MVEDLTLGLQALASLQYGRTMLEREAAASCVCLRDHYPRLVRLHLTNAINKSCCVTG
jgi:hypothetical protein